jgi:hypothetical protein
MFEKAVAAAAEGQNESEAALPGGWEELKAKARSRKKRLALQPEPGRFESEPPPSGRHTSEPAAPAEEEKAPARRARGGTKQRADLTVLDAEEVMAREEQLMLAERDAACEAGKEELAIRQALRKTAAGMGLASLRLTNAMNHAAREIEFRFADQDKIKDIPLGQLGAVLRAGSQLQEKTARVMTAAVELERLVAAEPLGDAMAAVGDREIDAPEAIKKLNRMAKIIERLNKKAPEIVAHISPEDVALLADDDEPMDDFAEMDEDD